MATTSTRKLMSVTGLVCAGLVVLTGAATDACTVNNGTPGAITGTVTDKGAVLGHQGPPCRDSMDGAGFPNTGSPVCLSKAWINVRDSHGREHTIASVDAYEKCAPSASYPACAGGKR